MLLIYETLAKGLDGFRKLDANHQAASAHLCNAFVMPGKRLEALHEVCPYIGSVSHKLFVLHNVEHSQSCGTRQMISTEGSAQLTVNRSELWRDKYPSHRKTIAYTFGNRDDVGTYVKVLMSEEATTAAITALYFVANQDSAVLMTSLLQPLCKFGRRHSDAAHALYAFQNTSGHIAFCKLMLPCGKVVKRQESNMTGSIDRRLDFRIIGSLDRK